MPEDPDESPPPPSPEEATELMTPPTGGASILPASAAPLQEIIGDFEVLGKLGAGGMGAVYRARQISLHREVALKVLPAQFIEDADSVARFQREARVAASLSHANLVKVYTAGEADGCHFIAMELIEGEDLGRRLKRNGRNGRMPPPEALRITAEVARGLEYAWRTAHLIHRDIKPANIFLDAQGGVKVGDLGLAKSTLGNTTGLTQTGTMMGTPHYISPEQARGDKEIDFRADIYSLGCTLYHMLTGQVPYGGSEAYTIIHQHISGPLPAILKVWPQCPIPLARLVGRMLKKARHERPTNYAELITQIESVWAQLEPLRFQAEADPAPLEPDPNATLLQTPAAPSAVAGAAEVVGRRSSPPGGQDGRPTKLYAGLAAAAVVVLAAVAFLAWPKPEEKLTKAQIYARDHAAELAATSETAGGRGSVAAPIAGSVSDDKASPSTAEPWQDVLRDPTRLQLWGPAEWTPQGLRLTGNKCGGNLLGSHDPQGDGAVRLRAAFGGVRAKLLARNTVDGGGYGLSPTVDGKCIRLSRLVPVTWETVILRDLALREPLQPGAEYTLELRVVGPALTVRCNGETLETVTDRTCSRGSFGVAGIESPDNSPTLVKSLEVLDLDAPAAASAPPAAGPWQDLLQPAAAAKLALTDGITLNNHQLTAPKGSQLRVRTSGANEPNTGALRLRARYSARFNVALRVGTAGGDTFVMLFENASIIQLRRWPPDSRSETQQLQQFHLPRPIVPGEEIEMEWRWDGSLLTARFNGRVLGQQAAPSIPKAVYGVDFLGSDTATLSALELLDLDALPAAASAAPASAPGWRPLVDDAEWRKTTTAREFQDGRMRLHGYLTKPVEARDAAVRVRVRLGANAKSFFTLVAREYQSAGSHYSLIIGEDLRSANLYYVSKTPHAFLKLAGAALPAAIEPGEVVTMELRVAGDRLTGLVNGVVMEARDDRLKDAGRWGAGIAQGEAWLESLEVQPLAAPVP